MIKSHFVFPLRIHVRRKLSLWTLYTCLAIVSIDNERYMCLRRTRVLTFLGGSNKLFYLYRLPTLRFASFNGRTVAVAAAQRDITLVPRVIIRLGLRR